MCPVNSFESIACAYDLLVNETTRWQREQCCLTDWLMLAGVKDVPAYNKNVLDLGCGTGFHARHIAGLLKAKVTGADPAQTMLDIARSKTYGNLVNWIISTAENPPPIPPDSNGFDLILLLGNTLSLIENPIPVIKAVSRIITNKGLFIIQMLDYEIIRKNGLQTVEKSNSQISITKTLAPATENAKHAADLNLTIKDYTGKELSQQNNKLYEHPFNQWQACLQQYNLTLTELRKSYTDKDTGSDRILVLKSSR